MEAKEKPLSVEVETNTGSGPARVTIHYGDGRMVEVLFTHEGIIMDAYIDDADDEQGTSSENYDDLWDSLTS